ncbi:hypothetical protein [Dokdonia sp.]|uniref:hypothetical protein n=1 Tax=Dokdonia sp. TaxID=2024995 RepID=UPI0032643E4C
MKFKLKDLKINRTEWISFLLTLIATLAGVLIAIWLTNSGIRSKEKEDTIKLLQTANIILVNTNEYANTLNSSFIEFERDTVNYKIDALEEFKSNNPIPYPDLLEAVISNELISKNISEFSHSRIYTGLINFKKLANYESVKNYQKSLEVMILLLNLEIENQKGEINSQEFVSKFQNGRKRIYDILENEVIYK